MRDLIVARSPADQGKHPSRGAPHQRVPAAENPLEVHAEISTTLSY